MGAVWLGRDELLGRMVALKQIGRLPGADSADLARAEREARLAARLNHPHVVAVYDLVVDGEARWLVMEYVDGSTLAQLVEERGRLSPDDAAPLLHQAADALVAGHAAGIVHRDVKPSNILVDQDGRVKLTDFGIARVAADPALTQTGMVIGSPAYLPPEVAAGQRGDESGDVWSLGATTFHVLSGRPPYEIGDQVIGGLYRIVNEDPPRLAEAGWMTALLEATMVKDPSRRWSMAQVRDFLAGPSGGVAPTTPIDAAAAAHQVEETTPTRMLGTLRESAPQEAARPGESPAQRPPHDRKGGMLVGLVGVALALVLALVLFAVLHNRQPNTSAHKPPASPTKSSSSSGTPSSHHTASTGPTARGMKSFVRSYVAAVASDPNTAWDMLTPKFQRQSGGLDTYRKFWSGVGHGQLLTVSADPRNLVVSYRVRFQNFGTGRRPTVLDLVFDPGRYLINGEHNDGFVPAS
jgi:serine/threonine protein kinase